jgi:hypothetical protein
MQESALMVWTLTWIGVALMATALIATRVNALRFGARVGREVQAFWPVQPSAAATPHAALERLPPPVRRYLSKAITRERSAVTTVHVKHGGTFRPKLDGAWLPIEGTQYIRAEPPAFVWWGRVRIAPGVWIDARDRSENGRGNMLVLMDSTFRLADSNGAAIDQGALLRLLGEMVWIPTAFLAPRVTWTELDARRARAHLRVGDLDVAGVFEFGDDELPSAFRAMRYRDIGHGKAELTEFYGAMSDYREVDGLLVPHKLVAHWTLGGEPKAYARWEVERIEYDGRNHARRTIDVSEHSHV